MRRRQLIELEDLPWFPRVIRDGGTDWLAFLFTLSGTFTAVIPKIRDAMSAAGTDVIVDLCSGAGGPWRSLAPALARDGAVRIVLSDLYPNLAAFSAIRDAAGPIVEFCTEPVDATHVPATLTGVRTMFNAFHHFPPGQAAAVLADAVAARQPIAIFEAATNRASGLLVMPLQMPAIFLLTPLVRPFRWSRLLFTYVVPLIPFLVLFDGIVSFLRLYGREELQEVIAAVPGHEQFTWQMGSLPVTGMPWRVGYMLGIPNRPPRT